MKLDKIRNFFRSLRFRGFLSVTLAGVIPVLLFSSLILSSYDRSAMDERLNTLRDYSGSLAENFVSLGGVNDDTVSGLKDEILNFANLYNGRVVITDANLHIIYDTFGLEDGKTLISSEAIKSFYGLDTTYRNTDRNYIELTVPVKDSADERVLGTMVLSFSLADIHATYEDLQYSIFMISLVVVVFIVIFAVIHSASISKPLSKLSVEIDQVNDGSSDSSIPVKGYSELRGIAASFNRMLGRVRKMEGSREEFVSNVSHELKTPMTSMKVLADSLISNPDATLDMYKDFMTDIDAEIERENKIINDLLELVKLDRKNAVLNVAPTDMNEMINGLLKRLKPLADKNDIDLFFESFRPVTAEVDEVKLSLALMNLIENAIKYNRPDGFVRVSLNADHRYFFVKVLDSGIGIPKDSEDRIFERFYRVDKARSRGTGGTGLGLSITKNIIVLHHGEIKVYSRENEGTTFTVRIPLSYIVPEKSKTKKGGILHVHEKEDTDN
ncbi:MAG: HAMP domain-containing sensor histidine kinase [Catonella sp.]|nr:HAMP domain-containing sensor histidine kinase [Catonella sp.]